MLWCCIYSFPWELTLDSNMCHQTKPQLHDTNWLLVPSQKKKLQTFVVLASVCHHYQRISINLLIVKIEKQNITLHLRKVFLTKEKRMTCKWNKIVVI